MRDSWATKLLTYRTREEHRVCMCEKPPSLTTIKERRDEEKKRENVDHHFLLHITRHELPTSLKRMTR